MNALVAAGKSLEEVQAARPTADFDEAWGKGFHTPTEWIEQVYEGIKRHRSGTAAHHH